MEGSGLQQIGLVDNNGDTYLIAVRSTDHERILRDGTFATFCLEQAKAIGILPIKSSNGSLEKSRDDLQQKAVDITNQPINKSKNIQTSNQQKSECSEKLNESVEKETDGSLEKSRDDLQQQAGDVSNQPVNKSKNIQTSNQQKSECSEKLNESVEKETDPDGSSTTRWDHKSTLLLISLFEKYKEELENSRKKKNVWRKISIDMAEKGYAWSADECDTKFRNLKGTYKKIKDKSSKTGQGKQSWLYFQEIDEIFHSDHAIAPLNLLNSIEESPSRCSSGPNSPSLPPKSRSTSSSSSSISTLLLSSPSTSTEGMDKLEQNDKATLQQQKKKRRTKSIHDDAPQWVVEWSKRNEEVEKKTLELHKEVVDQNRKAIEQNEKFQNQLLQRVDARNEVLTKMVNSLMNI